MALINREDIKEVVFITENNYYDYLLEFLIRDMWRDKALIKRLHVNEYVKDVRKEIITEFTNSWKDIKLDSNLDCSNVLYIILYRDRDILNDISDCIEENEIGCGVFLISAKHVTDCQFKFNNFTSSTEIPPYKSFNYAMQLSTIIELTPEEKEVYNFLTEEDNIINCEKHFRELISCYPYNESVMYYLYDSYRTEENMDDKTLFTILMYKMISDETKYSNFFDELLSFARKYIWFENVYRKYDIYSYCINAENYSNDMFKAIGKEIKKLNMYIFLNVIKALMEERKNINEIINK